jgi:hypothetical protein
MTEDSPVVAPRGRDVLVYASAEVLRGVRPVIGVDLVEPLIERMIARGRLSRTPRPGEPELAGDERLVRPFNGEGWVAVVRPHGGRKRRRRASCWRLLRVVRVESTGGEAA